MDLCVAGLYQPLLLLYADPNGRLIDVSAAPARNISLERGPCNILAETEHGMKTFNYYYAFSKHRYLITKYQLMLSSSCE